MCFIEVTLTMKNPSLYSPLLYFKIWTLVDLGEGPGEPASPLIFRPNRGPRPEEPNTFFLETAPFPPYLKVWIRHCWSVTCVGWMNHRHLSTLKLELWRMPDFVGKLYYESGWEGCKVHNLKTSFCTILALYITMNGKRLDYKALEKVFPARLLVLNYR